MTARRAVATYIVLPITVYVATYGAITLFGKGIDMYYVHNSRKRR